MTTRLFGEIFTNRLERGKSRKHWLYSFDYYAGIGGGEAGVESNEYWFVIAPDLSTARRRLRQAFRKSFTPTEVSRLEDLEVDAREYQEILLRRLKPTSVLRNKLLGNESERDSLLEHLGFLEDLQAVTPYVYFTGVY